MAHSFDLPWAVFKLHNNLVAVTVENIQGIILLERVTPVPESPEHVRGIINIRNSVIPLLDLRVLFGLESEAAEIDQFCEMLTLRQKEHVSWIEEIAAAVKENKEFNRETDPHKCKLGKWLDSYKHKNEAVNNLIKKFNAPHQAIHNSADTILRLKREGDTEAALGHLKMIRNNELEQILKLFEELKVMCKTVKKESAIIIEKGDDRAAVCVDEVVAVEMIEEEKVENADTSMRMLLDRNELLTGIGRRSSDDQFILLLSEERLLSTESYRQKVSAAG